MTWQPDYVTTAELKAFMRITDAVDDTQLAFAITAASRAIDGHCNRQFGAVAAAEAREYNADFRGDLGRWVVEVDDFMSVTGLAVTVDAGTITDFTKQPVNASQKGMPWTRIVVGRDSAVLPTWWKPEATVTAPWGWTAFPTPVKQATLLQASRFHARRDSPYGVAGSPDLGNELRLLARVDPDVAVALRGYVRPRAVA